MPDNHSGNAHATTGAGRHDVEPPPADRASLESYRSYWGANLRLIGVLLAVWAAVSLGLSLLLAPWLNSWHIGRLPLGFWWAQQGSIIVFVCLVFVYAWRLDRLDRRHGVRE